MPSPSKTSRNLMLRWSDTWRQDFLSSLVVFLVALPLCMGIALACGASVSAGLVTGIVGGIVVGFLTGAPMQVSGPAAGLTVICGEVIRQHGMAALGLVVLLAGLFQLIAGLLKFGQWFRAVSPAVIHGMLSGIGVLILSSQIHVMVDDRPRENGWENLKSIPEALLKGLPIPALEPIELRQARTQFLQEFGQLHEVQSEIESQVARTATVHGSDELHAQEAEQLGAFIPRQERILAEFATTAERVRNSPLASANGKRQEALELALAAGEAKLAETLADLKAHELDRVERSQAAASRSVANVLGSLKSHDWAAKIGLISIGIIVLWQLFATKSMKLIPGPLLAIVVATFAAWLLALPVLYVEVPENLLAGLTFPSLTVLEDVSLATLLTSAAMMAVIASAETLLCASAVDQMHSGPRTQYDKELTAQGIGNMLCGLLGALPMTGVIVRSAANVQAGARSNLSSILHGIWILLFVVALGSLLRLIPTAALAGILVYTGFKLIDWKGFFHLWKYSRTEAAIFVITLAVIVVEDLLIGVVTGIVLSAIKLLVTFSYLHVELSDRENTSSGQRSVQLVMTGAATFLRLPLLAAKLEEVPRGAELRADLEQLDYIDHACLDLLMNWARQHESSGGRLVIDWGLLHGRFRGGGRVRQNGNGNGSEHDSEAEEASIPSSLV